MHADAGRTFPKNESETVKAALALARLGETPGLTQERRAEYDWAGVAVEVQRHPILPEKLALQSFVGRYGPNTVTLVDGGPNRAARKLIPLTNELFAVEGFDVFRVRFGKDLMETIWMGDPVPRTFPRS